MIPVGRGLRRGRDERGASVIELALYMPLLISAVLLAVQFSLVYLGNQAASGAAREAARVARVTGSTVAGEQKGRQFAENIGDGVLEDIEVEVTTIGNQMRAEVSGAAQQLLPFLDPPRVSEEVRGPVERFVPDG